MRSAVLVVASMLAATAVHGQVSDGGTAPTPAAAESAAKPVPGAAAAQETEENFPDSPFDLSFGPQEDGGLGAVLKGSTFYPLGGSTKRSALVSPFVGVEVDAALNSEPDALNNWSVSLRPAVAVSSLFWRDGKPSTGGPWLYMFADGRSRSGRFEAEGEEEPADVDQRMLGAGVQLRWTGVDSIYTWLNSRHRPTKLHEPPSLTFTYYTVQSTNAEDDAILPEGITADVLQATLRSQLTIPAVQCKRKVTQPDPNNPVFAAADTTIACPWSLDLLLTASQPAAGGGDPALLADIGIIYNTGGKLKPVLRYRSGEEHGLEYDRQVLLGLMWELVP